MGEYGAIADGLVKPIANGKSDHELLNVEPSFFHSAKVTKKTSATVHYDRKFLIHDIPINVST